MPTFHVTQVLAKERVVRIEASNADNARHLAAEGYGEVVQGRHARLKLLAVLDTVRVDTQKGS